VLLGTPVSSEIAGQVPLTACNSEIRLSSMESIPPYRPTRGLLQVTNGLPSQVGLSAVKGRPKEPKYVARYERRLVTENVVRRMDARYRHSPNKVTSLAEESGVGRSTIQRIVDPDTYGSYGCSIDTLALLARALKCEAHDLLTPLTDARAD
jgi:hypothetical protein